VSAAHTACGTDDSLMAGGRCKLYAMNVAIFGGTFDPIHRGHIAVARAAAEAYDLGRIYFVPADIPPHKQRRAITPFFHRYAMVALATQSERNFFPSLLEAPGEEALRAPSYSIETVRRFRSLLPRSDKVYFLIGIDAFMDVGKWYQAEALLREVEFIVASRPGFSLADVAQALPEAMRPPDQVADAFKKRAAKGKMAVGGAVIHLLPRLNEAASATEIRKAAQSGRSLARWLPEAVVEYVKKMHLYEENAAHRRDSRLRARGLRL